MDYVRGMDQLAGMEGWSEEKWWCGRAGGAAWVGDDDDGRSALSCGHNKPGEAARQ